MVAVVTIDSIGVTPALYGPGTFSRVHDVEGRGVKFCGGEDSCSSQTTKEGDESTLLIATLRGLFVPQTEC